MEHRTTERSDHDETPKADVRRTTLHLKQGRRIVRLGEKIQLGDMSVGELMCTGSNIPDERALVDLLKSVATPDALAAASDPKVIKAVIKTLKAAKDLLEASDGPAMFVAGLSAASSSFSAGVSSGAGNRSAGAKVTASAISFSAVSLSLTKLTKYAKSPNKQLAVIGISFAEKVVIASGLTSDSDRVKCFSAISSIVLAAGGTAITGWTGVGGVLGVMSIVSGAWDVHVTCKGEHFGLK